MTHPGSASPLSTNPTQMLDPESADMSAGEDCRSKVFTFYENVIKMPDPKSILHVEWAHRIGKFVPGKARTVVAKFSSESKSVVKNALK